MRPEAGKWPPELQNQLAGASLSTIFSGITACRQPFAHRRPSNQTPVQRLPNRKELFEDPYFGEVRGEVVAQIEADYDFLEKESAFVTNYFGGSVDDERFDFLLEIFVRNLKKRRQSDDRIKNLS